MNIPTSLIVAVVVIVLHIIAAVARHAEKKKKLDAARRVAEIRRVQQQQSLSVPGSGGPSISAFEPAPVELRNPPLNPSAPSSSPSIAQEMASRRQAQLEQLRQRRDSRRAAALARPTQPVGPANVLVTQSSPAPTLNPGLGIAQPPLSSLPTSSAQADRLRNARARQEAQQAEAARERQRQELARRQAERVKQAEARSAAERQNAAGASASSKIAISPPNEVQPSKRDPYQDLARGPLKGRIQSQMRQPGSVRQLMIFKEIMDIPVALR